MTERIDPPDRSDEPDGRNLVERGLSLFAEVRPGEGANVLLLFSNVFLILTAYYILKVVREALTIGGVQLFGFGGDQIKAYLPAVMMVLLLGIVPLYGLLASAVSRVRLLNSTMIFVIVTLGGFWAWGSAAGVGTAIGLAFYIYIGIINVFLIAQFWSFANDIYSEAEGKRLFAIIALGQSLGAVLGPKIASLGTDQVFGLLLVSAGIFAVCIVLYNIVNRRESERLAASTGEEEAEAGEAPLEKGGGFGLVFSRRYLLLIAVMILVSNIVNTTGEYILANAAKTHSEQTVPALGPDDQAAVESRAAAILDRGQATDREAANAAAQASVLRLKRSEEIGRFYGDFFFWVNLAGVLTQMFLVSRIFKIFGVRAALFALPVVAFGGYAAIAMTAGALGVLRVAKTAENSVDYSLQNTVKQALFLPTTREEKYKAKAAIDTFFVRLGDTASAALVFIGLNVLNFDSISFAWFNVGLVSVWILLNLGIAREHRKLAPDDRGDV